MYPVETAYFREVLNVADFIANMLTVAGVLTNNNVLNTFRIIRAIRIPQLLRYISPNRSTIAIQDALGDSVGSLFFLILACFCLIYFFAIVGLQLWLGLFAYCVDLNFPAGEYRYSNVTGFPNGCPRWINVDDNFDNIWHSMHTIFRIVMLNEWHYLAFFTSDLKSIDHNLQQDSSSYYFIFYVFIVLFGTVINCLFVAVIYYHYKLARLWCRRQYIYGVREAMWILYEVSTAGSVAVSYRFDRIP